MLYTIILIAHVIFGTSSLLSGLGAMIVKKSRGLHSNFGSIYYWSMILTSVTALVLTILKFNSFLMAVGVFSLYLTYTGKVSIDNWRRSEPWSYNIFQWLPSMIGFIVSIWMISWPVYLMVNSGKVFVPVLGVFGIILLLNTIQDHLLLRKSENRMPKNRKFLIQHIGKMGGSYIAASTAFLVNNVSIDPGWIMWILPSVVGSLLIAYSISSWRKKLNLK
jgi:hypothetical protein